MGPKAEVSPPSFWYTLIVLLHSLHDSHELSKPLTTRRVSPSPSGARSATWIPQMRSCRTARTRSPNT